MVANSPTRQKYPLSPKKVVKKTLVAVLGWIILFGILYGITAFVLIASKVNGSYLALVTVVTLVILAAITILTYLYQRWYFNVYYYDLDPDFIVIRKGPITPKEITVPYQRIQDVYVDQDIWDRMFGLYDVHISSATFTSGMEAHIDGVEKVASDGLRTTILETVSKKIGRDISSPTPPPNGPTNH